jgi:hypothetical protein
MTIDVPDSEILKIICDAFDEAEHDDIEPSHNILSRLRSAGLLTGDIGKDWSWPIPCDVLLAPVTIIGRGVSLGTLVTALKQRERWIADGAVIPRLGRAALRGGKETGE